MLFAVAASLLLAFALAEAAPQNVPSLIGIVRDQTGATMPPPPPPSRNGVPFDGAEILVVDLKSGRETIARGDQLGRFEISPLERSRYRVRVAVPGFKYWTRDVDLTDGVDRTLDVVMMLDGPPAPSIEEFQSKLPDRLDPPRQGYSKATVRLVTADHSAIRGVVLDHSGAVIPNASILISPGEFSTLIRLRSDKEGRFERAVDPGTYSVRAEAHGFAPSQPTSLAIATGEAAEVEFSMRVTGTPASILRVEPNPPK